MPRIAVAQSAPEALPSATPENGPNPPSRVGRLADLSGQVSFHGPGDQQWTPATLNFPVTSGDAVWTEPDARAAVEVSGDRMSLAGGTELDVQTLDDQTFAVAQPQGEAFLQLRGLLPNEVVSVETPRGTVSVSAPGRYDIIAGDTAAPTRITVLEGAAQVQGQGLALTVSPGETATITGDNSFAGSVGPAQPSPFLTAMVAPPAPAPAPATTAPPAEVEAMSGGDDLANYGTWQPTPQYGTVWYPQVAAGWAPYRDGHWAYVQPWGWTWVDNAPWGFAPFHYGRWVQVGDRWGWAPVYAAPGYVPPPVYQAPPVYAPALVAFLGVAAGIAIGAALAPGQNCGWVPLGWNEPYRPWYPHRPNYVQIVNRPYLANVTHLTNITTINNVTINNFANRRAATLVPAGAIINSRPIGPLVRPVAPGQLAALRPALVPPVRPTAATLGVTPAVARQLRLAPAPSAAPRRVVAPGPSLALQPPRAAPGRPTEPMMLRPPLRPTAVTPRAATPEPVRPVAPVPTPHPPAGPVPIQPSRPAPNEPGHPELPGLRQPQAGRPEPPAQPARLPTVLPAEPVQLRPGQPAAPVDPHAPQVIHPLPPQQPHAAGVLPQPVRPEPQPSHPPQPRVLTPSPEPVEPRRPEPARVPEPPPVRPEPQAAHPPLPRVLTPPAPEPVAPRPPEPVHAPQPQPSHPPAPVAHVAPAESRAQPVHPQPTPARPLCQGGRPC